MVWTPRRCPGREPPRHPAGLCLGCCELAKHRGCLPRSRRVLGDGGAERAAAGLCEVRQARCRRPSSEEVERLRCHVEQCRELARLQLQPIDLGVLCGLLRARLEQLRARLLLLLVLRLELLARLLKQLQ